jgi:hypothetical protein
VIEGRGFGRPESNSAIVLAMTVYRSLEVS